MAMETARLVSNRGKTREERDQQDNVNCLVALDEANKKEQGKQPMK